MTEKLNLGPLKKAVAALGSALKQPKNEFVRDAAIQRFEYTYELCWKMLRRFLLEDIGADEINRLNRRDLYRIGADKGLLANPEPWFAYHQARNETAHIYDEIKAEQTYAIAGRFIKDARALLKELERRNG